MTDAAKNRPSHKLFIVTKAEDGDKWDEVGVAWATKDGKGYTLDFKDKNVTGRIIMRPAKYGQKKETK